jgi:hypothetical protein
LPEQSQTESEFGPPDQPDPRSADESEVEYWLRFYRDLLAFEELALGRMQELARGSSDAIRAEVMRSNIRPMQALIEDLRGRLAQWEARGQELSAEGGRGSSAS